MCEAETRAPSRGRSLALRDKVLTLVGFEPGMVWLDWGYFLLALPARPFFLLTMPTPDWYRPLNVLLPLGVSLCAILFIGYIVIATMD